MHNNQWFLGISSVRARNSACIKTKGFRAFPQTNGFKASDLSHAGHALKHIFLRYQIRPMPRHSACSKPMVLRHQILLCSELRKHCRCLDAMQAPRCRCRNASVTEMCVICVAGITSTCELVISMFGVDHFQFCSLPYSSWHSKPFVLATSQYQLCSPWFPCGS